MNRWLLRPVQVCSNYVCLEIKIWINNHKKSKDLEVQKQCVTEKTRIFKVFQNLLPWQLYNGNNGIHRASWGDITLMGNADPDTKAHLKATLVLFCIISVQVLHHLKLCNLCPKALLFWIYFVLFMANFLCISVPPRLATSKVALLDAKYSPSGNIPVCWQAEGNYRGSQNVKCKMIFSLLHVVTLQPFSHTANSGSIELKRHNYTN